MKALGRRSVSVLLGVAAAVLSLAADTRAATNTAPPLLPIQGRLTDATGQPLTGSVDVVFKLLDASTGGTALFTETQTVAVSRGDFLAHLGAVTPLDLSLFKGNDAVWLEVKIVTEAQAMTPRARIATTPYAGFAQACGSAVDAAKLGGATPASYHDWAGLTGVPPLVGSVGGTAPIVSSGGTTPAISIAAASGAAPGSMSASDFAKLASITAGAGVASVGATSPIVSIGGTTPALSILPASTTSAGSMSAADFLKLASVTAGATVATVTGMAPIVASGTGTRTLGIPVATSSADGHVSAADWIDFQTNVFRLQTTFVGDSSGNPVATPLSFSIAANEALEVEAKLTISADRAGGLHLSIAAPAAATLEGWYYSSLGSPTTDTYVRISTTGTFTATTTHNDAAAAPDRVSFRIVNGASAGTVTFRLTGGAAGDNPASIPTLAAGSSVRVRRVTGL